MSLLKSCKEPIREVLKKHRIGLQQGFGQPSELLGDGFGRNTFAEDILYFMVIGLVKISILAFYWRLFGASIRIPCYILGAITACWEVAVVRGLI